jgi:putative membrane protein
LDSVRKLTIGFWIFGAGLIGLLVYLADLDVVLDAVTVIGWGFAALLLLRVAVLVVDSHSWRCLVDRGDPPTLRSAVYQRWVGESVSVMLPFATIGGELARVRVIVLTGMGGALGFASVIVDGVVAVLSQFLFLCLGIALFAQTATGTETVNQSILVGTGALLLALLVLWVTIRRGGLGRLAGILKTDLASERVVWLADAMGSVDRIIADISGDWRGMVRAVSWRFIGWLLGAIEIWAVLYLLGRPISIEDALILDALASAVRTAFFFIPGGLVVQEGAMLAVGAVLGIDSNSILVAAVIKRAREIFFSIPGLLAWELLESRSFRGSSAEQ